MARASEAPASKIRSMQQQGRLPQPGQGPSAEQRKANWFRFVLVAEAAGDDPSRRLYGSVSGGDAGYASPSPSPSPSLSLSPSPHQVHGARVVRRHLELVRDAA